MACLLIFTIVDTSTALTAEEFDMGSFAHPGLTDENTFSDLTPALAKTGTLCSAVGASCKASTGVQAYKATGIQVHKATGVQTCKIGKLSSGKISTVQVASSTESESTTEDKVEEHSEAALRDETAAEATEEQESGSDQSSNHSGPEGVSLQLLFKGLTTEMVTAKAATMSSRMNVISVSRDIWTAEAENGDTIVSAHVVYLPGEDVFKSERFGFTEEVARHFNVSPDSMRVNQAEFLGAENIPAEEVVLHLGEYLEICWGF